jgi:hypothetical protein
MRGEVIVKVIGEIMSGQVIGEVIPHARMRV